MNLWPYIKATAHDEEKLLGAWKNFIHRTWEKEEMADPSVHVPIAHDIAQRIDERDRRLFLQGCSVEKGGKDMVSQTLTVPLSDTQWLDPRLLLEQLCVPLYLSHGRDDVVVPWRQIYELQELSPKRVPAYVTGFYDHTGLTEIWPHLADVASSLVAGKWEEDEHLTSVN